MGKSYLKDTTDFLNKLQTIEDINEHSLLHTKQGRHRSLLSGIAQSQQPNWPFSSNTSINLARISNSVRKYPENHCHSQQKTRSTRNLFIWETNRPEHIPSIQLGTPEELYEGPTVWPVSPHQENLH